MPKVHQQDYLPVDAYKEGLGAFHAVAGMLLFEFSRQELGIRDTIIRHFIARTDMLVRAVFELWELQDYQDCWVLHRCLLDRLFHLSHLRDSDEFELFEAWSFLQQYKAVNRMRSDPEFGPHVDGRLLGVSEEQKSRARRLAKDPPVWRRPRPEEAAKGMEMGFLYRFGYDFASTHVHPMANDGLQDFYSITGLKPAPAFPDQRSVLSNSLLVGTMVLQEALNASTLCWRALIYDFIDDFRKFLGTGAPDYEAKFVAISTAFEQGLRLCQPSSPSETRSAV